MNWNVQDISSTNDAFAAIKSDGTIVAWGDGRNGGDSSAVQDTEAECLYENCDKLPEAKKIAKEAKERKIVSTRADVSFVRPRGSESPIAGGLQGKRSLMLALVFALSKQRSCFDRCVTFLRAYSLDEDFKRLMADAGLSD
eukprot:s2830_g5.t2